MTATPEAPTESFATAIAARPPVELTIRNLIDAGAHYGHQTERWNPKMLRYIFGERNGVHIINLDKTLQRWIEARKFIFDKIAQGGSILFVGTKLQARDIIREEATRCGAHFITSRWLGGTLTNFQTIRNSLGRIKKLEDLLALSQDEASNVRLNKKERLTISRELDKLNANLGGIRSMKSPPSVIFLVDLNKEDIAIKEATRLKIPVIALTDTNVDPTLVQYPIPSNDDSARTLRLFVGAVADTVVEARKQYEARVPRGSNEETAGEERPQQGRGGRDRGNRRGGGRGGNDSAGSKEASTEAN
jgi:small subunit ribosomal protein S2